MIAPVIGGETQSSLILVADDNPINLKALELNLKMIGHLYRSEFYCNGQEIIDKVKEVVTLALEKRTKSDMMTFPIHALILDF
jgi:CheY-like chemotaxis protein